MCRRKVEENRYKAIAVRLVSGESNATLWSEENSLVSRLLK